MPNSSLPGPFGQLHHVGIAVADLEPVARAVTELLDGKVVDRAQDEELAIEYVWIEAPGSPIFEVLSPLTDDGAVARWVRERGPGLHHLSFCARDLAAGKEHARACGLDVIGESPSHAGYEEFFVAPGLTGGALFHSFRALEER